MGDPQDVTADRILRELLMPARSNSNSTITVNAGGLGIWVAVAACAVMLGVNLFLAVIVIDHGRKIDDLNDYLTAVCMMAPHLKPKDSAN